MLDTIIPMEPEEGASKTASVTAIPQSNTKGRTTEEKTPVGAPKRVEAKDGEAIAPRLTGQNKWPLIIETPPAAGPWLTLSSEATRSDGPGIREGVPRAFCRSGSRIRPHSGGTVSGFRVFRFFYAKKRRWSLQDGSYKTTDCTFSSKDVIQRAFTSSERTSQRQRASVRSYGPCSASWCNEECKQSCFA